jgi:hypothetical protein
MTRLPASRRPGARLSLAVLLFLLGGLAGCGGDDDGGDDQAERKRAKPVEGTFVGKVKDTKALVAVVASPAAKGQERRAVTVYVCDAARLCEWLPGSTAGNSFSAASEGDDARAEGELSAKAATGTIELPGGKTVRYKVGRATAAAGLYDLSVSARGKLRGASAAGVGLTGESSLPEPGSGKLKLADGTRLKVEVTTRSAAAPDGLEAGQVRLIVLPEGELSGAGKIRRAEDGGSSDFFIRSSSS